MEKSKIIEFWQTGENPITCYTSRPNIDVEPVIFKKNVRDIIKSRVSVTTIDKSGKKEVHLSVVKAAEVLKMNKSTLYSILNGHTKNTSEYEIFKSALNS